MSDKLIRFELVGSFDSLTLADADRLAGEVMMDLRAAVEVSWGRVVTLTHLAYEDNRPKVAEQEPPF